MTQAPPGWYPDPDPSSAGAPGRLRYWDGTRWTEHLSGPPVPEPAASPGYPQDYGQQPSGYYAPAAYHDPYRAGMYDVPNRDATPDGVPLAGWWWRVLAVFLDGLILLPLYALVAAPLLAWQWDSISRWSDDLQYAADNNTPEPGTPGVFWLVVLAIIVVQLAYQFLFLLWKQATPGKMITGLRVRLRERPELPAGAIGLRLLCVFLVGLCGIAALLDQLWPLWDSRRQALHDKMAKTNVVRIR